MSITQMFKLGFKIIHRNIKIVLISVITVYITHLYTTSIRLGNEVPKEWTNPLEHILLPRTPFYITIFELNYIVQLAIYAFFTGGFFGLILDALYLQKIEYKNFIRYGRKFFGPLFVITLLSSFLGLITTPLETSKSALIFLICFLISLLIGLLLTFATPMVVVNQTGAGYAISQSIKLVRRRLWQVIKFGLLALVLMIIFFITCGLLSLIFRALKSLSIMYVQSPFYLAWYLSGVLMAYLAVVIDAALLVFYFSLTDEQWREFLIFKNQLYAKQPRRQQLHRKK